MQRVKEALLTFHAFCVGLLLLGWLSVYTGFIPSYAYYFVVQSTFIFLAIALALSLYFNKSKLFVLLLFPLFFNLALAFPNTLFTKLSTTAFWSITPLSLSLGYFILYLLKEKGLFSSFGAVRVGIAVMILGGSYFALRTFSAPLQSALEKKLLHVNIHALFRAPDVVIIFAFFALLSIFAISLLFEEHFQKAPLWMLASQLIPCLWMHDKNSFVLFSFIASFIAIVALVHDAYRMAYVDTLTGILGRRALEEHLSRLGSSYTIAMVDIDHFKKFNDTFGHDVGDDVLKLIASMLKGVKNKGKAFRYGGEEFTIVFKSTKRDTCMLALEEIREQIFKRGFVVRTKERPEKAPKKNTPIRAPKKERLSVSMGVASALRGKTPHEIIKLADGALYKAKESGRNCIMFA